ncbi:MAG: DNA recombination protein RmuC [Burkholderiaceae bacterium]
MSLYPRQDTAVNDSPIVIVATVAALVAAAAAALVVWLVMRARMAGAVREAESVMSAEMARTQERLAILQGERQARENAEHLAQEAERTAMVLRAELQAQAALHEQKIALLQDAKVAMSDQFKSLANDILEEKSKRFAEQNQATLGQLLTPLRERMVEFKTKVEEIHLKDAEQQAALRQELSQLKDLNQRMTEEAHGLATALKGSVKKQGNWGELVLANVLDRSGLREGRDYKREQSFHTEEGRRRPDVVVFLPQNKHLVIDAKVSLNAYTRYVNAEDEPSRALAIKDHVTAVAERIQELSNKSYFELPGINSPEIVFMFVPVESAFVEALKADESLFQKAIEQNVLVATPTTLLTSLNIVRQLWRFEEQNANTADLIDRAAKIYRKLVTFLESMETLGRQIDSVKASYDKAFGQLYLGRGNLVSQAKHFENLGVAPKSPIPEAIASRAMLELELSESGSGTAADNVQSTPHESPPNPPSRDDPAH